VDHPAGGEPPGCRRDGLARGQPSPVAAGPQVPALGQDLRAALAVDRAVDAAAAEQRRVGRVHDRVDAFLGDVAGDQFDVHRLIVPQPGAGGHARARQRSRLRSRP
jgi:hypothetical protein